MCQGCSAGVGREGDRAPLASGIDLATFDTAVRPQDDLFRHVNGGWLAKTAIPRGQVLVRLVRHPGRQVAGRPAGDRRGRGEGRNKTPGTEAQKIGDFYESFMNEARIEELGLKPIEAELAAIDRIQTKTDLRATSRGCSS